MVSQIFTTKALATLLSVLSVANAHMIMKTPIPYGRGTINNSPLLNDGSDFPCKGFFDMTDPVNDVNHIVPGESNTLSFTGSAVHGGGSCQVSLTKDLKPTKDSKWMVIKSIEGGCPANVAGNLPADPNGSGASTFQYTVPTGFPEGSYTIAWTWFNKIGNREMYMNCGRADIGASKKRYAPAVKPKAIEERQTSFPDLFTANLAIFQCKVPDNMNVIFPNPGADLQTVGSTNDKSTFVAPTGCGASTGGSTTPDGGSSSGSGAASSAAASAPAASASSGFAGGSGGAASSVVASAPSTGSTGAPGVFASGAASASPAAPTASSAPSQASVAPVPASTGSSSGSSSSGSSSTTTGATAAGSACTDEGVFMCSADGSSFQQCGSGVWSVPMQMAAGMACTPGQSTDLGEKVVSVPGAKRDLLSALSVRRSTPLALRRRAAEMSKAIEA